MRQLKQNIFSLIYSLLGHLTVFAAIFYFGSFLTLAKTEQFPVHMVSLVPVGSGSESPSRAETSPPSKTLQPQPEDSLTQPPETAQKELTPIKSEAVAPKLSRKKEISTSTLKIKKITPPADNSSQVNSTATSADQGKTSESTPPANGSTAGESGQFGTTGTGASYNYLVISHLINVKRYPELARRRGLQGSVVLAFEVNRDGSVSNGKLSKSCSSDLLNEEALAMVTRASPFPAPPNDYMPGKALEFQVPIRFSLY